MTPPTCTEKGYTTYSCPVYGESYVQDYVDAAHTEGMWIVVLPAEIDKYGLERTDCTACGKELLRTIDPLKDNSASDDTASGDYLIGDANGDGKITAADARIVLRISAKLDNIENYSLPTEALDVTADGKINAADARKILRISAKLE